jgi:hypothetical protein
MSMSRWELVLFQDFLLRAARAGDRQAMLYVLGEDIERPEERKKFARFFGNSQHPAWRKAFAEKLRASGADESVVAKAAMQIFVSGEPDERDCLTIANRLLGGRGLARDAIAARAWVVLATCARFLKKRGSPRAMMPLLNWW